jgi:hypothetical protein
VKPGGIFARLVYRNGDVLQSMKGTRLTNLAKVLERFSQLRLIHRLLIGVRRGTGILTFTYIVE